MTSQKGSTFVENSKYKNELKYYSSINVLCGRFEYKVTFRSHLVFGFKMGFQLKYQHPSSKG